MNEICFNQSIVGQTSVGYSYNKVIYDNMRVVNDSRFQDVHIEEFTDFIRILSKNQSVNIHTMKN